MMALMAVRRRLCEAAGLLREEDRAAATEGDAQAPPSASFAAMAVTVAAVASSLSLLLPSAAAVVPFPDPPAIQI